MTPSPRSSVRSRLLNWALIAAALVVIVAALERAWPLGSDYFYHFRPLADQWHEGYWHMFDGTREILLYPPWSLFVFLPLGWFSLDLSKALLLTASVAAIIAALRLLYGQRRIPPLMLVYALVNLHSFDMYIRGQIDSFVLLGVALGAWAIARRRPVPLSIALCLMTIKPPAMVALPLLLYALEVRRWSRRELLWLLPVPLVCLGVSALAFGIDWPLDFVRNLTLPNAYLSISLWRAAELAGLPTWPIAVAGLAVGLWYLRLVLREGFSARTLALGSALTFIFTPYANGDHYVVLLPAFIYAAQRDRAWAVAAALLSLTPLSRLVLGYDSAILDIGYPICLALAAALPARGSVPAPAPGSRRAHEAIASTPAQP